MKTQTVLVLSGTGSCCYARTRRGREVKVGGWGHVLGDQGSGYDVGLQALKAVLRNFDQSSQWSALGQGLLRRLNLNDPNELIGWAQLAGKEEIAALAPEALQAASRGDRLANEVLKDAAGMLAADAVACARRLGALSHPSPAGAGEDAAKRRVRVVGQVSTRYVLAGGMLLQPNGLARRVTAAIRRLDPQALVTNLKREAAWGAIALAGKARYGSSVEASSHRLSYISNLDPNRNLNHNLPHSAPPLPPTERRHPRSMKLDRMKLCDAIRLMAGEDARLPKAILAREKEIERAIRLIADALKSGGRLFYVGAGTSGRLGILDASECPPTFRTPPDLVQGIIAGGQRAIWESIEGAEDDAAAGASAIVYRGVSSKDVVVGIAASGRTPFVWGALGEAQKRRAKTILLAFNPRLQIPKSSGKPSIAILVDTGPEILTGSTRLKAGTATKMILNMFTTLAMVRLGKVIENLMVDVNPSNAKLRERAVSIVSQLARCDAGHARQALEQAGWEIRKALVLVRRGRAACAVLFRG